ncbi:MAG TPA: TonB-dependent receptor, partial [Burkholderiaceae bacterium]|nr:TonB-dependent receptor [Burkholderiaceae bacterium]
VNFHMAPGHTVRAAVSKGMRTPDLVDQYAKFTYTSRTSSPGPDGSYTLRFYQSAQSLGQLRNEDTVSKEIGYLFTEPKWGLSLDLKVFEDRLRHLISEPVNVATLPLSNRNATTLRGAEVQASFAGSAQWYGFRHYAYLHNVGATTFWERTQYSRHSGSVGVSHALDRGWQWSLAYYGASGNGVGETRYGRMDVTVSRRMAIGSSMAEGLLSVRHLETPATTYIISQAVNQSSVKSRLQGFLSLRISF